MDNNQSSTHYNRNPLVMTICPLELHHTEEICSWSYQDRYAIYNWPSWAQMQKDGIEFGDSVLRAAQYAAVIDDQHRLIGYAQFFPITGVTRLGLGLRPDLCGRGLGPTFIRLIAAEALRRKPENEIDLEVLAWNVRAVRAYEHAGFKITDTYTRSTPQGDYECYCMVYESGGN
ncbi:GNAT family N-acetyltransferase [Paenibacillus luteus]|uniref:GNAT family N-acetyltransferase n=1 Tax=Paenibacillus luteus TaxID=2545753 RepID=UPI001141E9CF|nr:GNAT family protein [Paenibacillus luteus]